MAQVQKITPNFWFDSQAQGAATPASLRTRGSETSLGYGEDGKEQHKRPPGSVMTVEFELDGKAFIALNGGPVSTFNEAISFVVTVTRRKKSAVEHARQALIVDPEFWIGLHAARAGAAAHG